MFDRSKGIASVLTKSKEHKHIVSMEDMTCGCGKWQLFHNPCCHVLAVCEEEGISIRDCVASEYSTQACNDTWSYTFNPQPDITQWKAYDGPKHILDKLFKRTKRGRHPTKRRHNKMDARRDPRPSHVEASIEQASARPKRAYKCSICGVVDMPRRGRSEAIPDVPSLAGSLDKEGTFLPDVTHLLHPGPMSSTLLYKHDTHRSKMIWETPTDSNVLTIRHRGIDWPADESILPYIIQTGFGPWYYMQNYEVDWSFMTTLMERWRSETHTFHLRNGEMPITLEDVGILTGLPIEGRAVTTQQEVGDYRLLCL
ncbi:hypothetical protein QQ045_020758 [Rhodiola kirilowii]